MAVHAFTCVGFLTDRQTDRHVEVCLPQSVGMWEPPVRMRPSHTEAGQEG